MHRKTPISVLVYNNLFPTPSPTDPPSFSAHLSKNLVGEVRIETANFYGSLDTIEARYPGLNYAHGPHRKRLGRFQHHARLFAAFDSLGLTNSEIQAFCRWEGTLWARERYERDEGVRVTDTTGTEISDWVDRRKTSASLSPAPRPNSINVKTDIEVEIEQVPGRDTAMSDRGDVVNANANVNAEDEDDHDEIEASVGFSLNARLLHAAALRSQGHANITMDPEWEQYLKEAQERGELNIDATRDTLRTMADRLTQMGSGVSVGNGASAVETPPTAPAHAPA
ncbi:hypothetical protein P153DRAFT_358304 [Dothidotthia symphoricarpi CBS 119687]|uniref:Uncharacterized protein n=1 Tax=Dothidotthia symphoricarpi CBS 119687 TaxID=1392245 RepID=A0A6A6A9G6_9PLEO|nr:uncharacterized protein P153DRAFT_358304 [Dothidotthia symphoricarpi CBS 119687]KAF2128196.1 hypothetical protein P153DRAFT_358304 [Dothidotthia symphoricarpi CBS 119687]